MELIEVLTAIVVAYLEGSYPTKDLSAILNKSTRTKTAAIIPELSSAFAAYDAGTDFDWNELATGVSEFAAVYATTPGAHKSGVATLQAFAKFFRNDSESARKNIERISADLNNAYLRGYFLGEAMPQGDVLKQLAPVVRKLGGSGTALLDDEAKTARVKNPLVYKQYLALRAELSKSWKIPMQNYVRMSGRDLVALSEVEKALAKQGIKHGYPSGFTGLIDALGNWYTSDGEKIAGGAPSAHMFPTVRMNPQYPVGNFVFQAIRADGTAAGYFYTESRKQERRAQKFEHVAELDIESVRRKWLPMIQRFVPNDNDPEPVAAIIMEILLQTSHRIGTSFKTDPKSGGLGINTLMVGNTSLKSDGSVRLKYLGKDSVPFDVTLKPTDVVMKRIIKAIKALREGKGPRDKLFTYTLKNGDVRPVQPGATNKLFQRLVGVSAGSGVTIHKLRTIRATDMFRELTAPYLESDTKLTPKQTEEALLKAATQVALRLNHVKRNAVTGESKASPSTSLKNYIDVDAQVEFFMHFGCPIPKYLEQMMNTTGKSSSFLTASAQGDWIDTTPNVNGKPYDANSSGASRDAEDHLPESMRVTDSEVKEFEAEDDARKEAVDEDEILNDLSTFRHVEHATYLNREVAGLMQALTGLRHSGHRAVHAIQHEIKHTADRVAGEWKVNRDVIIDAWSEPRPMKILKACGYSLATAYGAMQAAQRAAEGGIMHALAYAGKHEALHAVGHHTSKHVKKVDQVLNKLPGFKKLTGPAMAGFLMWGWTYADLNNAKHWDVDAVQRALKGDYSVEEFMKSGEFVGLSAAILSGRALSLTALTENVATLGIAFAAKAISETENGKLKPFAEKAKAWVAHLKPKKGNNPLRDYIVAPGLKPEGMESLEQPIEDPDKPAAQPKPGATPPKTAAPPDKPPQPQKPQAPPEEVGDKPTQKAKPKAEQALPPVEKPKVEPEEKSEDDAGSDEAKAKPKRKPGKRFKYGKGDPLVPKMKTDPMQQAKNPRQDSEWWKRMSDKQQRNYLRQHPKSVYAAWYQAAAKVEEERKRLKQEAAVKAQSKANPKYVEF